MEQESAIRKVFKNEIAQLAALAAGIWFFVTTVIIPINTIQSSLATIQTGLADIKMTNTDLNARTTQNSDDIITIKGDVNLIKDRLKRYNIK